MSLTSVTHDGDLADLLTRVGQWLSRVRRLADDTDFDAWRHDEEPGALLKLLLDARCRLEAVRFALPEWQAREVRLVANALPVARLQQLTGDDDPGDKAA